MTVYNALFTSLVLVFAFACILWGLRIFKIFLIVLGLWVGFATGLFIGELFAEQGSSLLLWGLGGALICAIFAWPLQKLFVFTGVGFLTGFLVFAVIMSQGGEPQTGLIAGSVTFLVSGFVAVLIYDYFVIIMMSLVSAYAIINVSYLPDEFRKLFDIFISGQEGMISMTEKFGGYYAQLIWPSVVIVGMVVLFAVYMQKILPHRKDLPEDERKLRHSLVWYTTFFIAFVIVAYSFLSRLCGFNGYLYTVAEWSVYEAGLGILSPGTTIARFCHCPILNVSPISFPLAAFVSFHFIRFYRRRLYIEAFGGNRWFNGWIVGLTLGIIILPFTEAFTLFAMQKFDSFTLAGQYWLGYYKSFVEAPILVVLFKWLYTLILFPVAFMLIVPRPVRKPREESTPPAVNYCI